MEITNGIYCNSLQQLFLVTGVATHQKSREPLVIFYPLWVSPEVPMYAYPLETFQAALDGVDALGPLRKIMDWDLPNIVPGRTFITFTIRKVFHKSTGEVIVEARDKNGEFVNIPIEAFIW